MINGLKCFQLKRIGAKPTLSEGLHGLLSLAGDKQLQTPGSRGAFGRAVPAGLMHRLVYKFGSNANWIKPHHAGGVSTLFDSLHTVSVRL